MNACRDLVQSVTTEMYIFHFCLDRKQHRVTLLNPDRLSWQRTCTSCRDSGSYMNMVKYWKKVFLRQGVSECFPAYNIIQKNHSDFRTVLLEGKNKIPACHAQATCLRIAEKPFLAPVNFCQNIFLLFFYSLLLTSVQN